MNVHVLFPPHTLPTLAQSHCAFSAKSRRLGPLLRARGYHVTAYAVGLPDNMTAWDEAVSVLDPSEQRDLLGYDPLDPGHAAQFVGRDAHIDHPLYRRFNERLALLLRRVQGDDVIACTFGHAHQAALTEGGNRLWYQHAVETGIGYPQCFSAYRIYESQAWKHWHLGKDQRGPWLSEWVVPNDFAPDDWPLRTTPLDGYVLYFGRLGDLKGLREVVELAQARPGLDFVLCGQGDPAPYLTEPNIRYLPPVAGRERIALLHGARCLLMPTRYVEPFGGVAVEAMFTGTPCLTADHSAFTETVPDAFRCRTRRDWLAALDALKTLGAADRQALRDHAINRYSSDRVADQYDAIFQQLPAMRRHGWYT